MYPDSRYINLYKQARMQYTCRSAPGLGGASDAATKSPNINLPISMYMYYGLPRTQPPTLVPANMSGYRYTGLEVGTASAIEFIDKPGLHTCTFNKLSITNFCVTTCINHEEESTCTCRSSLHMSHFSHVKVYPQFIHTLYNIHVLTKAFSGSHSSSEILSPFCSAACF